MLDAFLGVLVKQAADKSREDALVETMMSLPMKDLQKIASTGSIKAAYLGDGDEEHKWLCKYEGTPLYDKAMALEEELLQIEGKRIAKRMREPEQSEDLYALEDMVRLKKRQLDLELSKQQQATVVGEEELEEEEPELEEAPHGEVPKPEPSVDEEKAASARFVGWLIKDAAGEPKITAAAPKKKTSGVGCTKTASVKIVTAPTGFTKEATTSIDLAGRLLAHAAFAKTANELTPTAREHIKPKNFAVPAKKSDTGAPKYPVENKAHAANALTRVRQFGSPAEKSEVFGAVAKKYPGMAEHSSIPAVKKKAETKEASAIKKAATVMAKIAAQMAQQAQPAPQQVQAPAKPAVQPVAQPAAKPAQQPQAVAAPQPTATIGDRLRGAMVGAGGEALTSGAIGAGIGAAGGALAGGVGAVPGAVAGGGIGALKGIGSGVFSGLMNPGNYVSLSGAPAAPAQ